MLVRSRGPTAGVLVRSQGLIRDVPVRSQGPAVAGQHEPTLCLQEPPLVSVEWVWVGTHR